MPIQFRCDCGKLLEVPDGTEGRRTKCPACQSIQTITPPQTSAGGGSFELEDDASESASATKSCPQCGQAMAADSVLCVQCGYNVETGEGPAGEASGPQGGPEEEFEEEGGGLAVQLPIKQIVLGGLLVAVGIVGWLFVVQPIRKAAALNSAHSKFTNGDLDDALAEYRKLSQKMTGEDKELCELRAKQIELEKKLNTGKVFSHGRNLLRPEGLEITNRKGPHSGAGLSFKIKCNNETDETVVLKKEYFYVRGSSDLITVHIHEDNDLGQRVKPGERVEALAHFRRLPQFKANRKLGRRTEQVYFMTFNDGERYAKWLLNF